MIKSGVHDVVLQDDDAILMSEESPRHSPFAGLMIKSEVYDVVLQDDDAIPLEVRAEIPQQMQSIRTSGDGACSMHAVFGKSSGRGELYEPNARSLAANLLGASPQELLNGGAEAQHVRAIRESLWSEFTVPALQGNASVEGTCFWEALCLSNIDLAEEATQLH